MRDQGRIHRSIDVTSSKVTCYLIKWDSEESAPVWFPPELPDIEGDDAEWEDTEEGEDSVEEADGMPEPDENNQIDGIDIDEGG